MKKYIPITEFEKFGRWTALHFSYKKGHNHFWRCKCDCGNIKDVAKSSLQLGKSESCGCLQKELVAKRLTIHGNARKNKNSSTYKSWRNARTRCFNPNINHSNRYYHRGIIMCPEWSNSFEAFLKDMGERPKGKTLDRINNDGNYEPGNCRWATWKEQAINKKQKSKGERLWKTHKIEKHKDKILEMRSKNLSLLEISQFLNYECCAASIGKWIKKWNNEI